MEIVVHDTVDILEPLYAAALPPTVRFAQAQGLFFEPDARFALIQAVREKKEAGGFGVMRAAQRDGFDVLASQQLWGLFNPTRLPALSAWAFSRFREAGVLARCREWLTRVASDLAPTQPPRLDFLLLPADPANRSLMVDNHGLSAFAGVAGTMLLELWPSAGNLARLEPLLTRLCAHTMRWAQAPATTLADYLVLEGLASSLVAVYFPQVGRPWLLAHEAPDDAEATLSEIAAHYGLAHYSELRTNVYGSLMPVGEARPPQAPWLDEEEREYTRQVLGAALTERSPQRIAAYLYGDEILAAQGHPTVGLSPLAGFHIAHELVQGYLRRAGHDLATALTLPTDEILTVSDYFKAE